MRTVVGIAVLATVISTGVALKCYICNSHDVEACSDLPPTVAEKYLKECGDEPDGEKYTLCRKIDMYMDMDFGKHHPAENRVHRSCGYEENLDQSKDCYYKSGYNTRSWVCACKEDGCNSASLLSATTIVLPLAAITAVLRGAY